MATYPNILAWRISCLEEAGGATVPGVAKSRNQLSDWLVLWAVMFRQVEQPKEIDKFLETYSRPRLNHDEVEDLNKPITSKETDSQQTNKKKQTNRHVASLVNSTKYTN